MAPRRYSLVDSFPSLSSRQEIDYALIGLVVMGMHHSAEYLPSFFLPFFLLQQQNLLDTLLLSIIGPT